MAKVLEVKDRNGKIVYLTDERYKHILKHPEMQNILGIIENTVKNPDKMLQYSLDPAIRFYHTHHKNRKSNAKYLRVVVKYLNGEGFVITAFFVASI